jgi:hypothetical protein
MNFTPDTTLTIRNQHYTFVMNDRNTIDQDESGGRAVIYQILNTTDNTIHALKVFKDGFRESYNSKNFTFFQTALTDIPGFEWVPQRLLINPNDDKALLDQHPYLENAIVMPWFALPKLDEIRGFIKKKKLTNIASKSKQFASLFAYALAELENRGIAHGDIATSNVFFDWVNDRLVIIDIEDMFHKSLIRPSHLENAVGGTPNYRFSTQFTSWQPSADRFAGAIMISEILTLADDKCIQAAARETYFNADDIANREWGDPVSRYPIMSEALDDINAKASEYLKTCWNAKATEIDKLPKLSEWRDALGKPPETLIARLLKLFSSPTPAPAKFAPTPVKTAPATTEPTPAPVKSTQPQRPAKTPYERKADSDFPTLIVFMLDLSRSMFEYKIGADYRIDVACNLINNIIETLVNRARKSTKVKPRYHVAVLGYHKNTAHILQGELVQSIYNTGEETVDNNGANTTDGIYPLGIFNAVANPINRDSINHAILAGAGMKDFPDGETHMTQAFESVYALVKRNIERYADCHPPYIFHITDGANNDGKNPQAYTDKIKQLTTEYGNVLISTAYIGQGLIADQGDARTWPGITDNTHFTGDRAAWAQGLRALSSRMPAPYHAILTGKKEFVTESDKKEVVFTTYPKLSPEAYLFFPGDNPDMLRLAMAASVSTGTTGK